MTSPKQCGNSKEGLKVLSLAATSKAGTLPCLNPWKQQPISLQCWTRSGSHPLEGGQLNSFQTFEIIKENVSCEEFIIRKITAMASDLPNGKWTELLTATLAPTHLLHRLCLWTPHLLPVFVQRLGDVRLKQSSRHRVYVKTTGLLRKHSGLCFLLQNARFFYFFN